MSSLVGVNYLKTMFSVQNVGLILRIGFGLIFLVSGSTKLTDLSEFSAALGAFRIVPEKLIIHITYLLPITEILLGGFIILGFKLRMMCQVAILLLTLFTAVTAIKLSQGEEIICACFGGLTSEVIDEMTIARNVLFLLWGAAVFAFASVSSSNIKGNASNTNIWNDFQKMTAFIFVLLLIGEIFLLGKQNKELKKRLAMLVGDTKSETLKTNEMVPAFTASDLNGKEVEIAYREIEGKTILFILSTNCNACAGNLNNWREIANRFSTSSARVFAISIDPLDVTKNYVTENDLKYPVFVTSDLAFYQNYKPALTPQTILIDVQGRIEKIWVGMLNERQKHEILKLNPS